MAMNRMLDEDIPIIDGEVTMDLTCLISLSIGDGVKDHLRPIIAKSSEPVYEFWSGLVSSIHTIMNFLECLLCLFV